ncbi:uncharacterized protein EAF01_011014 [Botrytis porri]|uniref:RTA1 like protein n=1 Tax=Botrytis porri TaxID=87229 RepID=A0A4Z1KTS9_9HELO|nr:uncharacterized protein EAF01_011014 [Botrytis porri]KAF7887860.1 hypothetical protein EAF01_011014 [Botrytis porri]TGO87914.1 hypothetical protein BPOR_0196g00160 [Botrytis porri]
MDLYAYAPSASTALVAAALFGLSTIYHLFIMIQKKTYFYSAMVAGGVMMTSGYVFRHLSANNTSSILLYSLQSLFIILPPSLYAATIYMIYGRIVLFVNAPSASLISPKKVTKLFVGGDVISFLMQAGGGGMMATPSTSSLGEKVMIGGLLAQLFFFNIFLVIAITFERRMRSHPRAFDIPARGKKHWHQLLMLLFVAAGLIIARCVYRVIEFSQGSTGTLMSHEYFMYILDTAPMFAVQCMFHVVHAANVFEDGVDPKKVAMMNDEYIGLGGV